MKRQPFRYEESIEEIAEVRFGEAGTTIQGEAGTSIFIPKAGWDNTPPNIRPKIGDVVRVVYVFYRENPGQEIPQ